MEMSRGRTSVTGCADTKQAITATLMLQTSVWDLCIFCRVDAPTTDLHSGMETV